MKVLSWTIGVTAGLLLTVFACGAVANWNRAADVNGREDVREKEAESRLRPRAVALSQEYDFGVMDPMTEGVHEFVVRNEGEADLQLALRGKTCMCVGVDVEPRVVPPGESAIVRVHWDTKLEAQEYRHGATIATNDPEHRDIKFRVNGRVKTIIGAEPVKLINERIMPGEASWTQTTVFSQEWDEFEIEEITTSLKGLRWEVEPADEDRLAKHRASCGYLVKVATPTDLPQGTFHEWLRIKVKPRQGEDWGESQTIELSLHGNVIRRIAVYGSELLKPNGSVYFGMIRPEQEVSTRLIVRSRDELPELNLASITTEPSYVEAELLPYDGASGKPGAYYLDIKIPPRTATGNHIGYDAGHVKLSFDHPRIKELKLFVEFAVLQAH